ncbi:carboxylating nicotinate-nucleotide diphosphorylase [Clostridium sp. UBA4548]|uniref:carboxylating nicotinate-nucleotide diphosphorylase n=1 Tax=Clostridium sp. UBA4548 TaxID=1946361 RepID=UPI0032E3BE0F
MNYSVIDKIILNALEEDMPWYDISTSAILKEDTQCSVQLISKDTGIIAGLMIFKRVFELLGKVEIKFYKEDGDKVNNGELIAELSGSTSNILSGERTALNFLQRMSGIATLTSKFVSQLEGTSSKLLDTRKTTPGLRILEKYAVKIGGGYNHRFNLSDGVMLKDNHIAAAGGIKKAVALVRSKGCYGKQIEVEVESLDMVVEALDAKADIIMLDNMDIETMKEAISIIAKRAISECSGNVNLKTIKDMALTGVDYISVGELTHSADILDFSMKNLVIKNK